MKICIVVGTRPEIIKMGPIMNEAKRQKLDYFILHTGQHYSYNLDMIFFKELNLPLPKYNLSIGSGTHGDQTGRMLIKIEKVLLKEQPDMILVEGDTNTVLAATLAAIKLHIKVGHVESGLRSFNKDMPEELNRIMVDHVSDYLFAPTIKARQNLLKEGISSQKIVMCGNTIVDAILENLKVSKQKTDTTKKLGLKKGKYILMTIHRQENVDNKNRLKNILKGISELQDLVKVPIIFLAHPRTLKMIDRFNLKMSGQIKILNPVGFLEFLQLEANAGLILTDSGGVQEEACILNIPCVTLRNDTERPETLQVGANVLVGANPELIKQLGQKFMSKKKHWKNPFGNGKSSKTILKVIKNGR